MLRTMVFGMFTGVTLLGWSRSVFADDDEVQEVVVTGTRTPESAQRSTVHVDVVTRDEGERRGATNVAEALRGEVGVQVNPSAYGSIGSPSAIQIQGLDRDRVLVLEDGERVIGGIDGAVDLSQLPLTDVKQIELVTGPTSALYGTQALGGVVNIVTGAPHAFGPGARFRGEGRYPLGALAQGQGFYRHDALWAGVETSAQYGTGIRLRDDVIDYAIPERRQYLVGGRVGAIDLAGFDLQLRLRWIRDEQDGLTEEQVPGLGAFRIELPDRVDRVVMQARELYTFGGGSTVRFSLSRQHTHGVTEKDRIDSPVDEVRRRDGTLQSAETVITIADGDRTWVAGARGEVETFEQRLERFEILGGELTHTERDEVDRTTLGHGAGYAQLKWDLHEMFTVLGGARAEAHLRFGGVVAPRLALAFRPADEITIRAAGGRGFRVPSARELGFFFDHAALGYRVIGNPDLRPEQSWGVNGEISVRPTPRGMLRASVYANFIDDLINVDFLDTSAGGVDDYTYENVDEARTFGWQLDGRWQASRWLRTEAGYSYTWTRNDTAARPLAGRPPHTVFGALVANFDPGFEIVTRFRVVTDAFVDDELRSPGFATLDARLSYAPHNTITVYGGALNLLGAQKDPFRLGDQRPLAGRTFYLGLTATYPEEET